MVLVTAHTQAEGQLMALGGALSLQCKRGWVVHRLSPDLRQAVAFARRWGRRG